MSFSKLTWGVKASFRSYVEAASGSITVSAGVTVTDEGTFTFPVEAGGDFSIAPDGSASGAVRFLGSVTFEAHGGMLKSTLSELALEAGEDGLVLTVLDAPMNKNRCAVAELELLEVAGDVVTLGTKITVDGMYQIADNYPPGTELDPIMLG
jgi:hypothetical protein